MKNKTGLQYFEATGQQQAGFIQKVECQIQEHSRTFGEPCEPWQQTQKKLKYIMQLLCSSTVYPSLTMSRTGYRRVENINLFTCSDAGGRPRLLPRGTLGSSKSLSIGSSISGLEHDKWREISDKYVPRVTEIFVILL